MNELVVFLKQREPAGAKPSLAETQRRWLGVLSRCNGANMIGYVAGGLLLPMFAPRTIMAGTGIAGLAVSAVLAVVAGVLTTAVRVYFRQRWPHARQRRRSPSACHNSGAPVTVCRSIRSARDSLATRVFIVLPPSRLPQCHGAMHAG